MDTRKADLEELRRDWQAADRRQRELIERSAQRIRKESGAIKSMRERLVKEHRAGNVENIKDIHAFIDKKERYRNE